MDLAMRDRTDPLSLGGRILWLFREPWRELAHRPHGQIPALDALRSLAILFVIFMHVSGAFGTLLPAGPGHPFMVATGWFGVDLFFVLSGYFIGRQLWRELKRSGGIRIGRFMLRRGLRIWPLYFFFFGVAALLNRAALSSGKGWSDLVFLTNYFKRGIVMGSWSLCTEEQFYILAPLFMIAGAAVWSRSLAGYRKVLWVLLALLPLSRAWAWWRLTGDLSVHNAGLFNTRLWQPLHTHADGLVLGLLLANVEVSEGDKYKQGFLGSAWCVLAAVAVAAALRWWQREVFGVTAVTLVFGAATWALLSRRRAWLAFLESWPFYLGSRLSFGMYLNHEYMHEQVIRFTLRLAPGWAAHPLAYTGVVFAAMVLVSAAIALLTFCLVEHPFLRWRERLLADRQNAWPKAALKRGA